MALRALGLLCIVLLAVPAGAQSTSPAAGDIEYVAVLTGVNVHVRSGPGVHAYKCTRLSRPAEVRVAGQTGDWLKILPPPGCFSVISKSYVSTSDGKTGTLTGDNVWVRAGGELHERDNIGDFGLVQRQLSTGDTVEILGAGADYYKIVPPAGTYFYISARYVKPIAAAGTQPAPAAVAAATAQPVPVSATGILAEFRAADTLLRTELAKPIKQRDLESMLAGYKAIDVGDNAALQKLQEDRLAYVNAAIQQRAELLEVETLLRRTTETQQELEERRMKIEVAVPAARPVTAYTAEGVLVASELFPGSASIPRRYAIRDPETNAVTAYVQCTSGAVNLADCIGKYVGIQGTAVFHKQMLLNVVEAQTVVVLSESVELPAPPSPVVQPLPPPPAPKIEAPPVPEVEVEVEVAPAAAPPVEAAPTLPPAPPVEPKVEVEPPAAPPAAPPVEAAPTLPPAPPAAPPVEAAPALPIVPAVEELPPLPPLPSAPPVEPTVEPAPALPIVPAVEELPPPPAPEAEVAPPVEPKVEVVPPRPVPGPPVEAVPTLPPALPVEPEPKVEVAPLPAPPVAPPVEPAPALPIVPAVEELPPLPPLPAAPPVASPVEPVPALPIVPAVEVEAAPPAAPTIAPTVTPPIEAVPTLPPARPEFQLPPVPVPPDSPAPTMQPAAPTTTRPAVTRPASTITITPLPTDTGLEIVVPTTQPTTTPVVEEEYE